MVETTDLSADSSGASAEMLNRLAERSPSDPPASISSQQNPPAIVEPYLATLPSDSDSSDDRSIGSSTDDSHEFRPSHHLLGPPALKRTASVSSISSYGTDAHTTGSGRDSDDEPITPRLGSSGSTAQNWMTCGPFTAFGRWFRDREGRTCLLRGVNLCGNSKLPTKPSGSSHLHEGFFEHRDISFVGRPFPLEEVDEHLGRLKAWGLTFVRLLVPWEALEHSGPGVYDDEYIDYLVKIIEKMPEYGIKCFIDPHQDTWSRFSGGSGAPGWTFEVAGLDLTKFMATGAAYVHNTISKTGELLPMVWPTNYTKLASATMFTLFWAGNVFAPNAKYEGVSVQDFLQERYIACYQHLARKIQHLDAAIGFEVMNEPHEGYIGLKDLNRFDANHTLVYGDAPSALQSFALGAGLTQEVEVWGRSWPYPTRKHKTRMVNEEHESAWLEGRDCIWRQHGVWDVDPTSGKPKPLRPDYFQRHPETGEKVGFYKDFYLEFVSKYSKAIQSINSEYFIFVEPLPNEPPPVWTADDHNEGIVYAPHWYDLKSLFTKTFDGYITHDVQGLSHGKNVISATYFGLDGAKKNYSGQVRNIVKDGLRNVGAKPCIIGECGIPMDLNDKRAFETNDYTHQSNFLDAVLSAMERNLVYFTLWNYNPSNDNTHGDHWNGEDFSIYSPVPKSRKITETKSASVKKSDKKQRIARRPSLRVQTTFERKENSGVSSGSSDSDSDPGAASPTSPFELVDAHFRDERTPDKIHYHHIGGRALDAVLRPYAAKVPGEPESMVFNLKTLAFTFKFTNYPAERSPFAAPMLSPVLPPEVEIFVPSYHYGRLDLEIRVSEGDWRYVKSRQTLYWRVKDCTTEGITHMLRIRVVDSGRESNGLLRINGHAHSEEAEGSYSQEEEDTRTINQLHVHMSMAVAFGAILVAIYWKVFGSDWGSMFRL